MYLAVQADDSISAVGTAVNVPDFHWDMICNCKESLAIWTDGFSFFRQ